jgi:hypothetical protein
MNKTIVDQLYHEFKELVSYLDQESQISFHDVANKNFTKVLLLAAASYFEDRLVKELTQFIKTTTRENELLVEFCKNKAISRQYHTYFDWDKKNANRFFGLFGDSFKKWMEKAIKDDDKLATSIQAFIEIGGERNRLVHQDFGTFTLEKTTEEIYQLYKEALYFVDVLPEKLGQFPTAFK